MERDDMWVKIKSGGFLEVASSRVWRLYTAPSVKVTLAGKKTARSWRLSCGGRWYESSCCVSKLETLLDTVGI